MPRVQPLEKLAVLCWFLVAFAVPTALIALVVHGYWFVTVALLLVAWLFTPRDACVKPGGHDGPCDCVRDEAQP